MMTIAESLKRFRTTTKLSQRQLAEKIGVPYQSYQTYEYGSSIPTAGVIIKIAQAFDVSTDYLLGLRDEPRQKKYDDREVAEAFALRDALVSVFERATLNGRVDDRPNAETIAAIEEVERGESLSRTFTTADELMKDLMSNA